MKKQGIYTVWYSLQFQASTEILEQSPVIKGGLLYCLFKLSFGDTNVETQEIHSFSRFLDF